MELTKDQEKGLKIALERYKNKEKYVTICGYAGSGKAQPVDTLIPTPEGLKKMGDLEVGDYVFDGDGNPTEILGVYPQGVLDNYEVVLGDGRKIYCNNEHIFKIIDYNNKVKEMTVQQMIDKGIALKNGRYKYHLPTIFNKPVDFPKKDFKIHPYTMGAFLGDGCCKEKNLTLSSSDPEIPEYIAELQGFNLKREKEEHGYDWYFHFKEPFKENGRNRIAPKTEEFFGKYYKNVGCYAYEKSIPDDYKYCSIEQRYALLQGLFDTDGSIINNTYFTMRLTSTSLKLINDVKEIFYSLGYNHLSIAEDNRSNKYTYSCYDLTVSIPNEDKYKFFKLKRKKDIGLKAKNKKTRTRHDWITILEINKMPEQKEMVCIYVDNKEHLYLSNDYIVTHNTTLVRFIIEALPISEKDVCYCCFTGKGAEVLKKKGNKNAMTLHKLLYESVPRKDGSFYNKPKEFLDYKVIVVDECSMAPKSMVDMLLKHNVFVIFLGDNFQLPQIDKKEKHALLENAHVFLSQIMRQAAESEIIQLSMKIRNGEPLQRYIGKEVQVLKKEELNTGMLLWADQILCATNKKRIYLNNEKRKLLGFSGLPQDGERVICLTNYWDDLSIEGESVLVNGSTGTIHSPQESCIYIPSIVKKVSRRKIETIKSYFVSDENFYFSDVEMDKSIFTKGKSDLSWEDAYNIRQKKKIIGDIIPREFDFAYALTTWKAQGSEWDKVLVLEENFPFEDIEHKRFLYTSITRASKKLVLIKK